MPVRPKPGCGWQALCQTAPSMLYSLWQDKTFSDFATWFMIRNKGLNCNGFCSCSGNHHFRLEHVAAGCFQLLFWDCLRKLGSHWREELQAYCNIINLTKGTSLRRFGTNGGQQAGWRRASDSAGNHYCVLRAEYSVYDTYFHPIPYTYQISAKLLPESHFAASQFSINGLNRVCRRGKGCYPYMSLRRSSLGSFFAIEP